MDGAYVALSGYKYQFDKTILEIFENPSKTIQIEQIQDYAYDDFVIQVKYHNTDYTAAQQKAKKKKPILQLIGEFEKSQNKKYILYIYLKGVTPQKKTFSAVDELEVIIGKRTKYSAIIKSAFIKNFTIIYGDDFESLYSELIKKIKVNYSKSLEEAEIYYSVISSHILEIITKHAPSKKSLRVTSKTEIDKLISSGKKIIFKSAYLDELGRIKYHKYLRKLYFSTALNSEPHERIFVIEVPSPLDINLIKEIILFIKSKWSKNKLKTLPDQDRFCPYIHFKGISNIDLVNLKTDLQNDGYTIKDGFNFFNASFSIHSIQERPTYNNKIFFKIINTTQHLEEVLNRTSTTKEVYQLFFDAPLNIEPDCKHVKIQIEDLNDIKNII